MTERQTGILKILVEAGPAGPDTLAQALDAAPASLNEDLDMLEEKCLINREDGFIYFGSASGTEGAAISGYGVKREIARAASQIVEEGETVLIESGSCCALFAEELAAARPGVTIITNSALIAGRIRKAPYAKIVLLGGEYHNDSQVMTGSMTGDWAKIFISEKFFTGAGGFTEKYGFTGNDHRRAQTTQDMARQADKVFVLTTSGAFQRQGVAGMLRTEQVTAVFTDNGIPPEKERFLTDRQVQVYKVGTSAR
jgi:DeoR/GlpR family transcriptional regulator of sugar metabolism